MSNRAHIQWLVVLIAALLLLVTPVAAQVGSMTIEPNPLLPYTSPGAYTVGLHIVQLKDASRDGRTLLVNIWYPALAPDHPTNQQLKLKAQGWFNATPDSQAAPYPMILLSPGPNGSTLPSLDMLFASHGFVVAALTAHPNDDVPTMLVDRPLDILFILDQIAAANQTDYAGIIDTDHVGIMGYTNGGYTTLALSGARIDPAPAHAFTDGLWGKGSWDTLAAYRAMLSPPLSSDTLWPAFTDARIHAALIIEACMVPPFGTSGLAAASVPILIIGSPSSSDPNCDDDYAFAHLGSSDRYQLTFIHGGADAGLFDPYLPVSAQLGVAFFDEYLKGQQDDAQSLTAQYVNSVDAQLKLGMAWAASNGG